MTIRNLLQKIKDRFKGEAKIDDTLPKAKWNKGWVSIDLGPDEVPGVFKEAVEVYRRRIALKDQSHWMRMVKPWSRAEIIGMAARMELAGSESARECLRYVASLSALTHACEVPKRLWHIDETVSDRFLKYLALTKKTNIDLDNVELMPYEPCPMMKEAVHTWLASGKITEMLFCGKKPPNIFALIDLLSIRPVKHFNELHAYQKILTCIYLLAKEPIPLDYYYLDVEVYDFVKKAGSFEEQPEVLHKAA